MWKVLRRHQGLEDTDAPHAQPSTVPISGGEGQPGYVRPVTDAQGNRLTRFEINARSIANHSSTPQAAPHPDDALTAPHGDWVYAKLLRHAKHENALLRRKAYLMLLELFDQKQVHAINALHADGMAVMVDSLSDSDEEVRELACVALQAVVHTTRGQDVAFRTDVFGAFLKAVDDDSPVVVAEALKLCYQCHMAINDGAATARLIQLGCVPKYVDKIGSPDDLVCANALSALGRVFDIKEAFITVNDNKALGPITKALRTRKDPSILVEAAEVVSKLAFFSSGKRAAVHEHSVEPVLALLGHEDAVVRTAATGALVALTISEDGKSQALAAGAVDKLRALFADESERDVLVNAVKTTCNLAEHPIARAQLADVVPRLESIKRDADDDLGALGKSAERAVAMIKWQPGDVY